MATTTAKTKEDVNNMSKADRLWDSLNYSYDRKGERLAKEYNRARSQADRQALTRGMQRSSYNAQVLANIDQNRIDALNDNQSALIADYENRLGEIEQQEAEAERWERQFAASREDAAWNKEFQNKQYEANRADTAWQQNFQTQQYADTRADAERNWNFTQQQYADQRADAAWQQGFQERQYADQRADTAWNQAFQQQQYEANRADTAWQQEFSQKQFDAQLAQWDKEFNYTKMSDEQKIAYNYIAAAAANGGDVSDALLAQAGISRADYNAMKKQASASAAKNPKPTNNPPSEEEPTVNDESFTEAVTGALLTSIPSNQKNIYLWSKDEMNRTEGYNVDRKYIPYVKQ